jgi:hypothetical protein
MGGTGAETDNQGVCLPMSGFIMFECGCDFARFGKGLVCKGAWLGWNEFEEISLTDMVCVLLGALVGREGDGRYRRAA